MSDFRTVFTAPFKGIDLNRIIGEALEQKADAVNEINEQQLDKGLDAKGKSLGRYKNFKYKNRFQPVDLKLTGEFRRKFTLTAGKKSAEMFSQDQKEDILIKRYGKDIHGIQQANMGTVSELIKPIVQDQYAKKLLKK